VWRERCDVICEVRGTRLLYVITSCKTYQCQHELPEQESGSLPFGKVAFHPYCLEPLKLLHCESEFQWGNRCISECLSLLRRWKPCDDAIHPSNNHSMYLKSMYNFRRYFSTRKGQAVQTVKSEKEWGGWIPRRPPPPLHPHLISYYVQGFIIVFTAVECVGLFKTFYFVQKPTFALGSSWTECDFLYLVRAACAYLCVCIYVVFYYANYIYISVFFV
jgi:hypothetical protein